MSKYINEHKMHPGEAMRKGLDAGAAEINIVHNNGVIEVTNANGAILMQAKNVPDGMFNKIWKVLESCKDIDYRAGK